MSDFDTLLYRPLRSGREYDSLIPRSGCQKTALGEGMTDFSIVHMARIVGEKSWQMEKVARKLQKSSLTDTCGAIHDFLYNHFQYKADGLEQMLRSPACSWSDRRNGIDCKSYSILASAILTELGIDHYIRKIRQAGFEPDEWTHVYVVVPIDRKTASLARGYLTVDGTIDTMDEPAYIEAKDEFMSGLKHYGLNAPARGLGFKLDLNSLTSNCNSSSTNPNEIKALYPKGLQEVLASSGLLDSVTTTSLNNWLAIMNRMDVSGKKLQDIGGCTGEAGKYLRSLVTQSVSAVLDALRNAGFSLSSSGKKSTNITFTFGTYNKGQAISTSGYESDSYNVSGGSGALTFDVNSLNLTIGGTGGGSLPVLDINLGGGSSGGISIGGGGSSSGSGSSSTTPANHDYTGDNNNVDPDSGGLGTTGTVLTVAALFGIGYAIFSSTNKKSA